MRFAHSVYRGRVVRNGSLPPGLPSLVGRGLGSLLGRLWADPVLDDHARDPPEVLLVSGHDHRALSDCNPGDHQVGVGQRLAGALEQGLGLSECLRRGKVWACLLYTSDAADE